MCCSIQLARILLSIFTSVFTSDIGMYFSFLWHLCLVLLSGYGGHVEWTGMIFSCAIFWKSLSRIGNSCFQNFWQNSPVETFFCPGCFSVERFCEYSFGNLCLWLACFLSGSVLESNIFLRICPFLPRCPFYWHIIADSSLLWSFVFLCCLTSFSFSILLIWVYFFFWWVWLMIYQFCLASPRIDFHCTDLCYCLFHFFFIYFCSDVYDFFPSTNLGGLCPPFLLL